MRARIACHASCAHLGKPHCGGILGSAVYPERSAALLPLFFMARTAPVPTEIPLLWVGVLKDLGPLTGEGAPVSIRTGPNLRACAGWLNLAKEAPVRTLTKVCAGGCASAAPLS